MPEGEELWKLFLVIALNKIRRLGTFHRADKRDVTRTSAMDSPAVAMEKPLAEESMHLLEMSIEEILEQCPTHAQQMVRLRIEGCDVAEIAARTARSKRSVERVLQNFRAVLKSELADVDVAPKESLT